jgi:prepilin-type N-terminal cleavage/methylation domain-containing protein
MPKQQNIEFDRTLFKTSQSRSIKFAQDKTKGFTLIELLVVISIIALLSTVVLAVIQDGRIKAQNTAKNNLVLEYVKALELYRSDTGTYPSHAAGQETISKCIGYAESGDKCFGNSLDGSNAINSAFSTYIKGDFAHRIPIIYGTLNLNGVQYRCTDNTCNSYQLIWLLEKQVSDCISDATETSLLGNKHCTYSKL